MFATWRLARRGRGRASPEACARERRVGMGLTGREHRLDDELAAVELLCLGQARKHVALGLLHDELVEYGEVHVLLDGRVVVRDGQVVVALLQEGVGHALVTANTGRTNTMVTSSYLIYSGRCATSSHLLPPVHGNAPRPQPQRHPVAPSPAPRSPHVMRHGGDHDGELVQWLKDAAEGRLGQVDVQAVCDVHGMGPVVVRVVGRVELA